MPKIKAHTITMKLILPAAIHLTIIGESANQKLKAVLFLNHVICRRIDNIVSDINEQLVSKLLEY